MRVMLLMFVGLACWGQMLQGIVGGKPPAVASAPPTYFNGCQAYAYQPSPAQVSCQISNIPAGSALAVEVYWSDTAATFDSVAISGSGCTGTFTLLDNPTALSAGAAATAQAYAYNVAGGTCTITAAFSSLTGRDAWIGVHAIQGAKTSADPLDKHQINANAYNDTICADCLTSGANVTTTENNEYIFGVCAGGTGAMLAAGSSPQVGRLTNTYNGITEDKPLTTAGAVGITGGRTTTAGARHNCGIMTFKSATP